MHITTPYFVPDRVARRELGAAIRRGVDIRILVPGRRSDHLLTRRTSRRLYGLLLKAGARIYEYQPSMLHAKIMVVDDIWTVAMLTRYGYTVLMAQSGIEALHFFEAGPSSRFTSQCWIS